MKKWMKVIALSSGIASNVIILWTLVAIAIYGRIGITTPYNEWIIEIPLATFGILTLAIMLFKEVLE